MPYSELVEKLCQDMKIASLFKEGLHLQPQERDAQIRSNLSQILKQAGIKDWIPEPAPRQGRYILLGIALYSLPDLELLDMIVQSSLNGQNKDEHIQVFDVLTCSTMSDFEARIPGIGLVYQTPVVGLWEDGVLIAKASGASARDLVIKHFKL